MPRLSSWFPATSKRISSVTRVSYHIISKEREGCLPSARYCGFEKCDRRTTQNLIFSKLFPFKPVRFSSLFLVSANRSPSLSRNRNGMPCALLGSPWNWNTEIMSVWSWTSASSGGIRSATTDV